VSRKVKMERFHPGAQIIILICLSGQ